MYCCVCLSKMYYMTAINVTTLKLLKEILYWGDSKFFVAICWAKPVEIGH